MQDIVTQNATSMHGENLSQEQEMINVNRSSSETVTRFSNQDILK